MMRRRHSVPFANVPIRRRWFDPPPIPAPPEDARVGALHESAHACVAAALGIPVSAVSLKRTRFDVDLVRTDDLLVAVVAARAAERVFGLPDHSWTDSKQALELAGGDRGWVERALIVAERMVRTLAPSIQRFADVLHSRGELLGAELARLLPPPPGAGLRVRSAPSSERWAPW
jgi:hypothetical protein